MDTAPTKRPRLFFALDPNPGDRRRLTAVVTRLRDGFPGPDLRWLKPSAWHLTLRFLGETEDGPALLEALAGLSLPQRPSLRVRALGPFPRRRPVVLAARLADHDDVKRLAADLEAAARDCGFPAERRGFRAHLTVARFRRGARPRLPTRSVNLPLRFDRLCLYRSRRSASGARYDVVHQWRLDEG